MSRVRPHGKGFTGRRAQQGGVERGPNCKGGTLPTGPKVKGIEHKRPTKLLFLPKRLSKKSQGGSDHLQDFKNIDPCKKTRDTFQKTQGVCHTMA